MQTDHLPYLIVFEWKSLIFSQLIQIHIIKFIIITHLFYLLSEMIEFSSKEVLQSNLSIVVHSLEEWYHVR